MTEGITLHVKQQEAMAHAKNPDHRFILFRGGSRSGKTFLLCYIVLLRALSAAKSRHTILRKTAVDCRRTLFDLTFKDVMQKAYPGLWEQLVKERRINDKEMQIELPNGSIILFDGLDDSTREDRILGDEYCTIYVSEITQFLDFGIFESLMGRLNQEPLSLNGNKMQPKLFLDCNPTGKRHWSYKAFMLKENPTSGTPWADPTEFFEFHMNPLDNAHNLASTYMKTLANLSGKKRKRFLDGEWQDDNDNAIFKSDWWEGESHTKHKRLTPKLPGDEWCDSLARIIVAVDPAGSSKKGSDETGIIVLGMDDEGEVYILADLSGVYSPPQWAAKALEAYHDWKVDYIVTEDNYGREMVPNTIRMLDRNVPVNSVFAMRGKVLRAGPVATAYEQGRVHHCGTFEKLEDQLASFHEDWNRNRDGSPDRLDALVWGVSDLIVKATKNMGGGEQVVTGLWR
jgi:phage terminase large subunit-like protein